MEQLESISQTVRAVTSGQTSATEVTQVFLQRAKVSQAKLNCFIGIDEAGALAQAAAVDQKRQSGAKLGALAGVPISVKDMVVTRGFATTAGSKMLEHWVPPYDATLITHLRQADAILLGKTNMDEFAMGSSNENSGFGPCRNPWDVSRVPGGSSGGSAASVAARTCIASIGTDTGGSIRQPAAFCGVTGLKPTYGHVSRYGVIAFASSLDQAGPLAKSAEDVARIYDVIAGHDPKDATSMSDAIVPTTPELATSIRGLRIGVVSQLRDVSVAPEVSASCEQAISQLQELGAIVVPVSLPTMAASLSAYYIVATAEASSNLARYDGVRYGARAEDASSLYEMYSHTRREFFGAEVKRRILLGTHVLRLSTYDAYYKKAQQIRALIRQEFEAAFASVDAIVTPTTPTTAFALGEKASPLQMYAADVFTLSCNLAGLPGLSMPCGFSPQKLPIGLQLLGAPRRDATLLQLAHAYQGVTDWHKKTPEGLS